MDSIDQLKSSPSYEDQMDNMMMMMMMQLPEFSAPYGNSTTAVDGFSLPLEFHGAANNEFITRKSTISTTLSDSYDGNPPTTNWSSFTHYLPSNSTTTISFSNNNTSQFELLRQQEQEQAQLAPLLTNLVTTTEGANLNPYGRVSTSSSESNNNKRNSMAAMREMIFRMAAMQPINIDPESVKAPKRRNVKISKDPQSVAARHRRERISERIRILQRLVPGGTKMDTASMLDEAIHYVKFLKSQVQSLEQRAAASPAPPTPGIGFPVAMSSRSVTATSAVPPVVGPNNYLSLPKPYQARN